MTNYFKRRKMRRQFESEGLLPQRESIGERSKKAGSSVLKGQRAVYGFIDELSKERNPKGKKGKPAKRKNPFGKIKDRSFFGGGFF